MPDTTTTIPEVATLTAAHDADTLSGALNVRLCNDGRSFTARLMSTRRGEEPEHLSPIPFAAALVARLWMEGRGELADALMTLLSGSGHPGLSVGHDADEQVLEDWIGTPPNRHLARWMTEIAGPMVHPAPLGHGLVRGLRDDGRDELADAVVAVLKGAGLSALSPKREAGPIQGVNRQERRLDRGGPAPISPSGPGIAPLLPTRDIVFFPRMVLPLFVGRERSIAAIDEAMSHGKEIFLAAQHDPRTRRPTPEAVFAFGAVGVIKELLRLRDGTLKAVVEAKSRAKVRQFLPSDAFFLVAYDEIPESASAPGTDLDTLVGAVRRAFDLYVKLNDKIPADILIQVQAIDDAACLADTIAAHLPTVELADRQALLENVDAGKRLERLVDLMQMEPAGGDLREEVPEIVEIEDALAAAHSADVLAHALIARLCADGCEVSAARLMCFWAHDASGPIVAARPLAAALVDKLRADGRAELGATLATLLRGAQLREPRDARVSSLPSRPTLQWLMNAAGPGRWHVQPLTVALGQRLRADGHGELADAVLALQRGRSPAA